MDKVDLPTKTEFIIKWLVAESVEVIIRVLIGAGLFAVSAAVIMSLVYFGLNLSQKIQISLIVGLSAVLFWIVTSRFSTRDSFFWRNAAR
jgi:hypothetical protein